MEIWPFKQQKTKSGILLSQAVREKIDLVFAPHLRDEASQMIQHDCGFSLPLFRTIKPDDYDRIRFAVIKLSKGNLEALKQVIAEAHIDWRDVLMGAGFGYDIEAHLHWIPNQLQPSEQAAPSDGNLLAK